MPIFKRGKQDREDAPPPAPPSADNEALVKDFLRGQNLEQVGRVEEAIPLYESAVSSGFDAAGPYDRLIFIYEEREQHADVVRVAEASLSSVRTYPGKRIWYQARIARAREKIGTSPTSQDP